MLGENEFIRYEQEEKLEVYGPKCVRANNYMADIRKEMRSEKQILSEFLTVREFSKHLKHI